MQELIAASVVAYVIALPVWVPPVIMARRSKTIKALTRRLATWLAALSPAVAAIGFTIGNAYCSQGSTAVGFSGAWWPRCDNAGAAWVVMLAPATLTGLAAWWITLWEGVLHLGDERSDLTRSRDYLPGSGPE